MGGSAELEHPVSDSAGEATPDVAPVEEEAGDEQ